MAGAAVALAAVVVVVVLLVAGGGSSASPPPNAAARLVPAGTLAYVHVSTDRGRGSVAAAEKLAARFPSWKGLRGSLLARLTAPGCGAGVKDLKGREAALALVDGVTGIESLVLLDTGEDGPKTPAAARTCGPTTVRRLGRFLAVGTKGTVESAAALAAGKGRSLATDPAFRRATAGLPADRAVDGYATADGIRRILAAQGGIVGAAGVLLAQPGLQGTAFGLVAKGSSARITLHSALDPKVKRGTFSAFAPTLNAEVPAGALAYVGVRGLGRAVQRLLAATSSGAATGGVGAILESARSALKGAGDDLQARLVELLSGEVAVTLTPALPAPILTVVAKVSDEAAARRTMADLQAPLASLFSPSDDADSGVTPTFTDQEVDGVTVYRARLATGLELDYAVFDGKVVASTNVAGIQGVHGDAPRLAPSEAYRSVMGDGSSKSTTSLAFLDFSKLLRLGEQTGLDDSRAYQRVRRDLEKVRAVGAVSTGDADETTMQLELSIP